MKISFSFFFFLLITFSFFSQENLDISIPWQNPKEIYFKDQKITVPSILGQGLDFNKPDFYYSQKLKTSSNSKLVLLNFSTESALKEEISYLNNQKIDVSDKINIEFKITNSSLESFAVVSLFPFIEVDGIIKRIKTLNFKIESASIVKNIKEKSLVVSSVLAPGSGIWYKIGVKSDGIYKLDKSFLESCGISTINLNPSSINIYGNGDGKLPELNSVPRTDDLAKNAIYIEGESDGIFNDNDFILFYGWGPSRWYPIANDDFYQDNNIYSDNSYYYININASEIPLRISSINSTTNVITDNISNYNFYDTHESDLVSLVSGGQRWYGELFDTQLVQTFNFSVPNIETSSPAKFNVSMASNATNGSGTSQTYSVNGIVLNSLSLPVGDYGRTDISMQLSNPESSIPLNISVVRNSPSIKVYLDKITLNARRNLVFTGSQFNFRDLNTVGKSKVGNFVLTNVPSSIIVWEITDRHKPKIINGSLSGYSYGFQLTLDSLREFVASNNLTFLIPDKIGAISNQNLHGLTQADYLIVSNSLFLEQANRLADLHRSKGLTVHVASTDQIFNEFSSGMLDPTAIRSFAKMFYDRSLNIPSSTPKYLLLFGDGTFDPKNRVANNNNFVPTYQVLNSENHISALVSDDYYGFFDPSESMNSTDLLDIGIGRLLISDNITAKQQVDKIEHYLKNGSSLFSSTNTNCFVGSKIGSTTFGDWRLKNVMIADDEENGYFVTQDAEPNSIFVKDNYPEINSDKLYLDAYTQISNAGGQRYPEVYESITDRVESGALVVNYVGHGGETGVAEERVITIPQIQDWKNIDKLHLMVSATCEFTKFDDPSRFSAGEWASLNPYGASIALMTTSRSVFFGVNTITGSKFYENVFARDKNNMPLTFGEIIKLTKNSSGSSDNKRSFTLIGDPALQIALPQMKIITDSINSLSPSIEIDTIKALSKITIKGHLEDFSSNILTDFDGVLAPTVFDKSKNQSTLGQDSESPIIPFSVQKNALYKGKVTVNKGFFEFTFIVPKDINYSYGKGKISYYADNGVFDASGQDDRLIIGGVDPLGIQDNIGPQIDMHLNSESFANTGITDESPILLAKLYDENGINTVGNGIGHDILAILDGNTSKPIVLNEYYTSDLDSYQSGSIQYNFSKLDKGRHKLLLKVWDVNNNSSEANLDFIVQEKEELALEHVLNYPNPFTTKTEFYFEHNQVCNDLETQIQVFTVSGRLVKTINQQVLTNGFRSNGISWNGLDDYGDQLAKGVYVYRLKVKTHEGKTSEKLEKLVILK
jgi:hypothetical protein